MPKSRSARHCGTSGNSRARCYAETNGLVPFALDVGQGVGGAVVVNLHTHQEMPMGETIAVFQTPRAYIRRLPVDRPWVWLAAGWRDLVAAPGPALACGLVPVIAGWLSISLLLWFDASYLLLPFGAGFFFVGPFLAVGLYEISRRREQKLVVDAESTFTAWKRNPEQLALMGVLLLFFHLAWTRLAQLLFALFEWRVMPSWDRFADLAWFSSKSLSFLAAGVACGALLAAVAFTVGAFSIPYLLDRRESNLFEAIAISVAAVRFNWRPMALWASLIVILTGIGILLGLIGLVITLPLATALADRNPARA
jgi:uncharacterized membrane protein